MEEKVLKEATVVFLLSGEYVYLAKKLQKIGAGKLNSYGGGLENLETVEQAAIRELREESGGKIDPTLGIRARVEDLEKVAIIDFHNTKEDDTIFVAKVHFYFLRNWTGTPVATDEMDLPEKYHTENLPLSEMMPGDKDFLPQIFSGKKIVGAIYYKNRQSEMIKPSEIFEVEELPN